MEAINLLKKSSAHLMHIISNISIKRRFCSFLLISFFSFTSILKAQTIITGKVIDATSRQPLVAASITEEGNEEHAAFGHGCRRYRVAMSALGRWERKRERERERKRERERERKRDLVRSRFLWLRHLGSNQGPCD